MDRVLIPGRSRNGFLDLIRPTVAVLSRLLWRVRWRELENIPLNGGLIIAANHQTYVDPFWICCMVKRPVRFLAWDAAFSWPVVGFFLRAFGAWPLQLEGPIPHRFGVLCSGLVRAAQS
jgi:1-acyl-sn-glycerol-3-phosphate acyltransferase